MPKIEPAVLTMNFDLPGTPSTSYLDLSQCASILNRRFYRQGLNWAVRGFRFGFAGATGPNVAVRVLPNTWPVGAAWHKAFAFWKKQQNEALDDSGSRDSKARFNDFKIFATKFHKTETIAKNLRPVSPGGFVVNTPYALGEWEKSSIVVPNDAVVGTTVEYALHMVGTTDLVNNSIGIIKEYGLSRNYPHSPDPDSADIPESFLNKMFNVGMDNEEVVDNAIGKNNDLPYDQEDYPDGDANPGTDGLPTHREISFTATTIGAHQNMEGCIAPCGLIEVSHNWTKGTNEYLTMQVLLVPGEHRGYLAEPMQEMN